MYPREDQEMNSKLAFALSVALAVTACGETAASPLSGNDDMGVGYISSLSDDCRIVKVSRRVLTRAVEYGVGTHIEGKPGILDVAQIVKRGEPVLPVGSPCLLTSNGQTFKILPPDPE